VYCEVCTLNVTKPTKFYKKGVKIWIYSGFTHLFDSRAGINDHKLVLAKRLFRKSWTRIYGRAKQHKEVSPVHSITRRFNRRHLVAAPSADESNINRSSHAEAPSMPHGVLAPRCLTLWTMVPQELPGRSRYRFEDSVKMWLSIPSSEETIGAERP
jgi:hypothetical protein